jgi:hemoglobin/transferrin/lactoferrin receptor protein
MKKILFFYALVASICANAQTIIIRDNSTREALKEVVLSDKNNKTVVTDATGKADLTELDKTGDISTFHSSYHPYQLSDADKNGSSVEINLAARLVILNEVVLSANRNKENKIDVPYSMHIIQQKEIEFGNQPTTGDVIQNTGAAFVQKSQLGGGSVVLRGFEASRVLLVVDGVRMNNAIYRAGHLQDIMTLDPNMLDRTEILFGPSSTIYGSDALGGVMHFYTKNAEFSQTDKQLVKVNTMLRYATVNKENTGHIDINLGWKKIASMTNITYSNFGDLMSGSSRLAGSSNNWNRVYYAQRFGNRDSMVLNKNNNLQVGSAYSQLDVMQRLNFKQGANIVHGLNFQYSQSSDLPRYDRLTDLSGNTLRFAEWKYGPQKRLLASYAFNFDKKTMLSDNVKVIAAYQKINQDRITRRFQNNNRTTQLEDVAVLSLNVDAFKRLYEKHELRYGLEVQSNTVKSTAESLQIITGSVSPAATRYADGGNSLNLFGLYVSHAFEVNKNFVITDGIRFTANQLKSTFNDTTFAKLPYKTAEQNSKALTWNLGFTWKEENNYKFSLLANSGYRAPNVDDMTKVFESAGGILIIPNTTIKPEFATNFEIGLSKVFDKNYKFDVTGFYTVIENLMVLANDKLDGKDTVVYKGVKSRVQSMQNKNKGYIYGFSAGAQFDLNRNVSFRTIINYTYGRYTDTKNYSVVPLDHIPPVFGQTSILFKEKNMDAEFFVRYNAKKNASEYSSSGEDNASYSADPVKGFMPGWFTINLRAGYSMTKNFRVNMAFENITDVRYRVFASGINAPGKNFIVSLRYKF